MENAVLKSAENSTAAGVKRVHYVLGEGRSGRKLGLNVASGYVVPGLLGREVEGGGGKTVVLWNHARRERQELLELLLLYTGQCYWSQVNKVLPLVAILVAAFCYDH